MLPVDPTSVEMKWKCLTCTTQLAEPLVEERISPLRGRNFCYISQIYVLKISFIYLSYHSVHLVYFLDQITKIIMNDRYDIKKYVAIYLKAIKVVHPQHEIICEIAKWLLPIFCRGPGLTVSHFSEEDFDLKHKLCLNYLRVVDKIKPGLNKIRGK